MKSWRVGLILGVAVGCLGVSGAKGEAVRGDINGWAAVPWMQTDQAFAGDTVFSVTLTGTATRASSGMKFDQSGDWARQWGTGALATNAVVNSTIGQAHINDGGNDPQNLTFAETSGMKYTFRLAGENTWWYRPYVIQATTNFPVGVGSVTDNSASAGTGDVTVTAVLSAAPSGERVYVRYSTDGFASSAFAEGSVVGATATAVIPGMPSGRTVVYYVLTSAMPSARVISDPDLCTLRANVNGGANFSYLVGEPEPVFGECWHEPESVVQGTDVPMRNPVEPVEGESVYVYAGNYQADSAGGNMTNGVVWYRKGASGAWGSVSMSFNNEVRNSENTGWIKNWIAGLPTTSFAEGDVLQYVVAAGYDNRDATFLGTSNQVHSAPFATLAEAQGKAFSVTFGAAPEPVMGNCWHFPTNEVPWASDTMRIPLEPAPKKDTWIYVGNYQGDADMTGGAVIWRVGAAAWATNELAYAQGVDDDAYWSASISSNAVGLGDVLQYFVRVDYANGGADTTFIGTTDQKDNVLAADEGSAAAQAFAVTGAADLGNAWHVPGSAEPAGAFMRNPRFPYANLGVTIYNGNQFQGEGETGDQSGGVLHYRQAGSGSWGTAAMAFDSASANNKYWSGTIPAGTFAKESAVEYVLEVNYSDRDATYLGRSADGAASEAFATLAAARARPFDFTFGGDPGEEPGYLWHGGNTVKLSSDTLQVWVKIGYKNGDEVWADHAEVRYKVGTASPQMKAQGVKSRSGGRGIKAADPTLTQVAAMSFSHEEMDPSENGHAMWWVATITEPGLAAAPNAALIYQIAAWKSAAAGGNGVERLAEYRVDSVVDTFEYRMAAEGADTLRVNGVNADYTTTKFFIDEGEGETAHLRVEYVPPAGATKVQVFSNVGRRDYWDADLDGNGVADAIRPPSGDLVTTTSAGYFHAYDMAWDAGVGGYVWETDVAQCGAYRLTARHQMPGDPAWRYYSETGSGIRDHAVVVSPRKVLDQNMYELNALTVKATAATKEGRSTFASLIETSEPNRGTFNEFGIEYLNKLQANCLWFQPVHPASKFGVDDEEIPGSPYSERNYFQVNRWFGQGFNTDSALAEFQEFVAACDAGRSSHMSTTEVGTINIMLDGVFNHTSWDAVFGERGEQMGIVPVGEGADTAIGSLRPGWYANVEDYGAPATFYDGPAGGQHDIATAPDRNDFGKWNDTAELFFGNYACLVRHNPEDAGKHLDEGDWYDYDSMTAHTEELWDYLGGYPEYWLEKTGHSLSNQPGVRDANGTLLDDYGIDGLRCDFAQGLPPQFWEYIINRTRSRNWNFMFMAESLDGGVVSYRSNRHFDILNENFVFQVTGAGTPGEIRNALEERHRAYSGGAVLLNLTSHDETLPFTDPWVTASRFAMLSSVKGIPMLFYGQEQGAIPCTTDKSGYQAGDDTPGQPSEGFAWFELNMGKWTPHFKINNQLLIWDSPPSEDWSRAMAQWHGQVGWARLGSPALRSGNQYFLGRKHEGTYDNNRIFAVAKVEEPGAVASGKDAVLAFSLFVNMGDHSGANETYDLQACWDFLGLENSAEVFYNVRNLASSQPGALLWATPKSGAELWDEGIWVSFDSDQGGRNIYDDGAIVQYLKITPADAVPTETQTTPVPVPYAWLDAYYPGEHSAEEYEGLASQLAANGVLTVWQAFVAGLDPTDSGALFEVTDIGENNGVQVTLPTAPDRVYAIEFLDGDLTQTPQVWRPFVKNGIWTNMYGATSHGFLDDGTANTSGTPVTSQRSYRIWVSLPE